MRVALKIASKNNCLKNVENHATFNFCQEPLILTTRHMEWMAANEWPGREAYQFMLT